jgi:sugar phosphate isomerase/epimerase
MKVALQLYTVRDKVSRDYKSALRMVRESGYRFIEFAGHPFLTVDVDELRAFLDQIDLKPISTHISFDVVESNKRNTIFNYAYKLGLKYVVSEPDVRRINDLSLCVKVAEKMNSIGKDAENYGLKFGMHNHAIEFEKKIDGAPIYDILVENTDPSYVFFQPDVYWIYYAGYDPCEVIKALKNRCFLVHLKDMKDKVSKGFIELGCGVIDFKAVVEACESSGVEWYIVENDAPSMDSIESAKFALEYLRRNFKVE